MTYKAAIFDLDGTLLDSILDLCLSTNYALRQMGFAERTLDEVRRFVGNGVGKLIARAVPEGVPEEDVVRTLTIFKEHYVVHCQDNTAPYEGILPMLESLKAAHIPTAIVSNKLQQGVDELFQTHFRGLIDVAIGERPALRRKPAPDMVDLAVETLGVDKRECLYIGDSEVDVRTALGAGLDCVAVLWGFRDRGILSDAGAKNFVARPAELLNFFKPSL
ncbi:MAG: HAD family hydrolase [Bacteroidaceae bacterium]|nr:HAD family hydrolase [Bacteroidaceae bacterium]